MLLALTSASKTPLAIDRATAWLPGTAKAADGTAANGFLVALDAVFAYLVAILSQVLFFSIGGIPFIVLWLIIGAIFLRCGWVL